MLPWKYPGILTRILLPEAIFRGDPSGNRIYLTYDDGPDPEVTPSLLDLLAEHNARATFFILGHDFPWWSDILKRINKSDHKIALHGNSHRSKYTFSNGKLYAELSNLINRIVDIGIEPMKMYRPPFGHVRPDTVKFLKQKGIQTILWSSIPGDFRDTDIGKLFQRATHHLNLGDILALHDGTKVRPAPVLKLTQKILEELQLRGWCSGALDDK